MNPAAQGKRYPPEEIEVTEERVATFSVLFGLSPTTVAPTFLTVVEFAVFPQVIADPELDLDFARVVHGEQEYEWRRQPRVGETLTAQPWIASVKRRGGIGFVTIETEVRDAAGEPIATCRSTMIERGA
jgi:acyl dehydratase